MAWRTLGLLLMTLSMAPGCRFGAGGDSHSLSREAVHTPQHPGDAIVGGPDRPIPYNPANVEAPVQGEQVGEISPEVADNVKNPSEVVGSATAPAGATRPATRAASNLAGGQFMTIGGVVAEVNGTPIYANRVLNVLSKPLEARARQLDADSFRTTAREMIERQIWEFVRAELEFAAAQRNLEDKDREFADNLTMAWRQRRITEAGGSLQLAMQQSANEGEDFDQLLKDQYRTYMTQVFYQKRITPRIQITADDLRRYYTANLDKEFTEFDQISFRLIKIDPRNLGTREAAADRAANIEQRALNGEPFMELAGQVNHDPRKGAVIGPIQRGAYALQKVEQAAWETDQGKVVDHVVEDRGAFYIVFVEKKELGRVIPFEEEKVQVAIRNNLRQVQFQKMREEVIQSLQKSAIIRSDPKMMDIAVEMAMQNYPRWAAGKD